MKNELVERCPFVREGSASRAIYLTLAKSGKPMTAKQVAQASRLPLEKVQLLLQAYRNAFHNAPLRVRGIEITLNDGKFALKTRKREPGAKRPPRGMKAKKATKTPAKPAKAKATRKAKRVLVPATEPTPVPTAPETLSSVTLDSLQ